MEKIFINKKNNILENKEQKNILKTLWEKGRRNFLLATTLFSINIGITFGQETNQNKEIQNDSIQMNKVLSYSENLKLEKKIEINKLEIEFKPHEEELNIFSKNKNEIYNDLYKYIKDPFTKINKFKKDKVLRFLKNEEWQKDVKELQKKLSIDNGFNILDFEDAKISYLLENSGLEYLNDLSKKFDFNDKEENINILNKILKDKDEEILDLIKNKQIIEKIQKTFEEVNTQTNSKLNIKDIYKIFEFIGYLKEDKKTDVKYLKNILLIEKKSYYKGINLLPILRMVYDFKEDKIDEKIKKDWEKIEEKFKENSVAVVGEIVKNKNQRELKENSDFKFYIFKNLMSKLDTKENSIFFMNNYWDFYKQGQKEFLQDPSLKILDSLGINKVPKYIDFKNEDLNIEYVLRTCRTMYLNKIKITEENFKNTFLEIGKIRQNEKFLNKKIFKDKNVSFLYYQGKEDSTFLNSKIKDSLKDKIKNINFFSDTEDKNINKKSFFNKIENEKNITIIINTHGLKEEIFLGDKSNSNEEIDQNKISFKELAQSLYLRYKNKINDRPIIISSACFSQNYIRNLYSYIDSINKVKNTNIKKPIFIGESEYGHYGLIDSEEKNYKNNFLNEIFKLKKDLSIKDLMFLENIKSDFNLTIFLPIDKKGENNKEKIFQIN